MRHSGREDHDCGPACASHADRGDIFQDRFTYPFAEFHHPFLTCPPMPFPICCNFSLCTRAGRSDPIQFNIRRGRRVHDGQKWRRLHENANKYSWPQSSHLTRAKPKCKSPQSLRAGGQIAPDDIGHIRPPNTKAALITFFLSEL